MQKTVNRPTLDILLDNLIPAAGILLFGWSAGEVIFVIMVSLAMVGGFTILSNYHPRAGFAKEPRQRRVVGLAVLLAIVLFIGAMLEVSIGWSPTHTQHLPLLIGFALLWQTIPLLFLYRNHTPGEVNRLLGARFLQELFGLIAIAYLFSELSEIDNPTVAVGIAFLFKGAFELYIASRRTSKI